MAAELPKYLDVQRLADREGPLMGVVSPSRLRRIGPPFTATRPVVVRLDLRTEDATRRRLVGEISTELKATCQRCLDEMDIGIKKEVDVILVDSADLVSPSFAPADDVVAIEQGRIDIDQLVEDELILGCPMTPLHDDIQCRAIAAVSVGAASDRKKPFAGLAALITSAKKSETPKA